MNNTLANQHESADDSGAEALGELTNRALFLAAAYLARIIEAEGAIARGEPPPREPYARMIETFVWLCAKYRESMAQELNPAIEDFLATHCHVDPLSDERGDGIWEPLDGMYRVWLATGGVPCGKEAFARGMCATAAVRVRELYPSSGEAIFIGAALTPKSRRIL
jgi:hypothetical protein